MKSKDPAPEITIELVGGPAGGKQAVVAKLSATILIPDPCPSDQSRKAVYRQSPQFNAERNREYIYSGRQRSDA